MTPDYTALPRPERAQYITDAVSKWAMLFNFTEGAKAEIEEAVELAIERGDADNKESAVLGWAIGYKDECRGLDERRIMDSGKVAHA